MPEIATKQPPPVHLAVRLELPGKPVKEFSYDLQQPVISLGRDPSNDVQIPLTTVSRNHARIFFEHGSFFLEDLGSTHGTQHNGRKVERSEKRLLRDGDEIAVMSFRIAFRMASASPLDRQPGERTEALARRMVQEVLSSLGGSGREPPALRVMNGVDEGKRYEFSEQAMELTIGRSPECDIALDDQNASRRHCLVKRNWHGFTAQDLGSKNGVLLNGKPIEGAQLIRDGDELQVGGVKLVFIDPPSRLLDRMGGLEPRLDPEGVAVTGLGEPAEEEVPPEPRSSGGLDAEFDVGGSPDAMDLAGPESTEDNFERDENSEGSGAEPIELPPELAQVNKRGFPLELVILVSGGVFLLGAIALVAFLLF